MCKISQKIFFQRYLLKLQPMIFRVHVVAETDKVCCLYKWFLIVCNNKYINNIFVK